MFNQSNQTLDFYSTSNSYAGTYYLRVTGTVSDNGASVYADFTLTVFPTCQGSIIDFSPMETSYTYDLLSNINITLFETNFT